MLEHSYCGCRSHFQLSWDSPVWCNLDCKRLNPIFDSLLSAHHEIKLIVPSVLILWKMIGSNTKNKTLHKGKRENHGLNSIEINIACFKLRHLHMQKLLFFAEPWFLLAESYNRQILAKLSNRFVNHQVFPESNFKISIAHINCLQLSPTFKITYTIWHKLQK